MHWCDFYKSVSWNLPGAGSFVYAFVRGLLQLEVPISKQEGSTAIVLIYGTAVSAAMGADAQTVVVPAWAVARWPPELLRSTVEVVGLNVVGAPHTLSCDCALAAGSGLELRCSLVLDSHDR